MILCRRKPANKGFFASFGFVPSGNSVLQHVASRYKEINGLQTPIDHSRQHGCTRKFSVRSALETIFRPRRKRLETKAGLPSPRPKTGIVMLALILNAIYREFLTASLPSIVGQGAKP